MTRVMPSRIRRIFVDDLSKVLEPVGAAQRVLSGLMARFLQGVDAEDFAEKLDFSESWTTLHDHELGAEILKQTDLWQQFERFACKGQIRKQLGEADPKLSGSVMLSHMDDVARAMESLLNQRYGQPVMIRILSQKLKNAQWWREQEAAISKQLQKNRKKMRAVKGVMES